MIHVRINPNKRGEYGEFEVDAPFELLQSYLYSDLQIASVSRVMLERLRRVVAGTETPEEVTGNGWAVMPGASMSRVENMYTEKGVDVPTTDLMGVIEQWIAHVIEKKGDV